jgi:hypothetical protein
MNPQFALEIINGNWAIGSYVLTCVCIAYLFHEAMARGLVRKRWRWTKGMRVAAALGTLSLGTAISRGVVFFWRHVSHGGDFSGLQTILLILGATVGAVGYVCAIREISRPLYGPLPWIMAIAGMLTLTIAELIWH